MGDEQAIACVRFGAFELQPRERRLLCDGRPVPVGPRAFNLLVVLIDRAGQLVSKDELLDRVWPNLVVEENNLQVQVSALRKILGAGSIATVPGHGYRFTLESTLDVVASTSAAAPAPAPYNLPRQITSFVGRTRELAEVRKLLGTTRLLTLVGFGGLGKTRLALQVATGVVDAYPDGVWLVELASLTDARLVPQAVASVLGVREEPGRPVVESLLKQVRERRLLLFLDSCEHLIQATAELAGQLLQVGPHLKLLVTSRERLHLAGETTYRVPALTLPEPNLSMTLPALAEFEAVRLFRDRAVTAQPAFELTHQNAAFVADICRHVDGIPLAIELAAARARVLPVERIAERLSDRFRLLTRGDPTALPHRQTLRAMIDWSHDLLPAPERVLLRRLSVFAGGFTLEAAEAVGAGGEVAAIDVLDLLTELVEKSLVEVQAGAERYRLLDTVREYAREGLDVSGEADQTCARHLAFYLSFALEAEPGLRGGQTQGALMARLDPEWENFLAAHTWCDRRDDVAEQGLRLVYAVRNWWLHHGLDELGYRVTMEALARTPVLEGTLIRCKALLSASTFAFGMGRYETAQALSEEGIAIARKIGAEEKVCAVALMSLGWAFMAQGKRREAGESLQEALTLARRTSDERILSEVLANLAELHRLEGHPDDAEPLMEEALNLARESGVVLLAAIILLNLVALAVDRRAVDRARGMLLEALSIVSEVGSRATGIDLLEKAAGLAASCAEWRRAAQLCGAVAAQSEAMGYVREPIDEVFFAPLIARTREALGTQAFASAESAGRTLSFDTALAEVRSWLEEACTRTTKEGAESPRSAPTQ